jgi:hypothetical protein
MVLLHERVKFMLPDMKNDEENIMNLKKQNKIMKK